MTQEESDALHAARLVGATFVFCDGSTRTYDGKTWTPIPDQYMCDPYNALCEDCEAEPLCICEGDHK